MSAITGFWSHSLAKYQYDLVGSARRGPTGVIKDDLTSIVLLTIFSCAQGFLFYQVGAHLLRSRHAPAKPSSSIPKVGKWFAITSTFLGLFYIISAILSVVSFSSKLSVAGELDFTTPEELLNPKPWPALGPVCLTPNGPTGGCLYINRAVSELPWNLDIAIGALFQVALLLADGLIIYRCYVIFKNRNTIASLAAFGFAALLVVASTVLSIAFTASMFKNGHTRLAPDETTYRGPWSSFFGLAYVIIITLLFSSVASLIATGTALLQRDLTAPRSAAAFKLLWAVLPSALLGIALSCSTYPTYIAELDASGSFTYDPRSLRILWISWKVLAPQLMALWVLQGSPWDYTHIRGQIDHAETGSQLAERPLVEEKATSS